jgi:hypothetical protein
MYRWRCGARVDSLGAFRYGQDMQTTRVLVGTTQMFG